MREVNFSIPGVNKASVGITTALYDRRALDCTSTLPLINSLNHLAYLTTSSARIRDILTVDGGIERLVCILKSGRNKDQLCTWKWNLAFQCVVNIGVRGSEQVRTRVVEADLVPVIATILNNYIKMVERVRERTEEGKQRPHGSDRHHHHHHHRHRSHDHRSGSRASPSVTSSRSSHHEVDLGTHRRQIPPRDASVVEAGPSNAVPPPPPPIPSNPLSIESAQPPTQHPSNLLVADRTWEANLTNTRFDSRRMGTQTPLAYGRRPSVSPAGQPSTSLTDGSDAFLRPVREVDRLGSMIGLPSTDITSQPDSPTTPVPTPHLRSPPARAAAGLAETTRPRRRPSIRHQNSTVSAADVDEMNGDSMPSDDAPDADVNGGEALQTEPGIRGIVMEEGEGMMDGTALEIPNPTASEAHQTAAAFNIPHPTPMDGSIGQDNATPQPNVPLDFPATRTMITPPQPTIPSPYVTRYLLDGQINLPDMHTAVMPREEDVLMSLQLLAYVSKYCVLRKYFQQSHLVPKLRIDKGMTKHSGDEDMDTDEDLEKADDEEYLLPNDFNLFPLVEKFTMRHHSTDMQYWAGVVMRNLCRKDDTKGGIRQCANYQCGRWEEYTRQFAKCRRCRRTKYCCKECQKRAWAFHRHWCVAATS